MKKLTLAFTFLTAAAMAGTAFADDQHDRGWDNDHRDGHGPIVVDRRTPHAPIVVPPPVIEVQRPAFAPAQWELVGEQSAFGRRGTLELMVPRGASFDQLRLIASNRGLDILGVELTYARGRKELVRPAHDGMVAIDVGRGRLQSIKVRYANSGRGRWGSRDASIKVLGKDEGRMTMRPRPPLLS